MIEPKIGFTFCIEWESFKMFITKLTEVFESMAAGSCELFLENHKKI